MLEPLLAARHRMPVLFCYLPNHAQARSLPNISCMLTIAVARSSSGGVTQSQGEGAIWGVFFKFFPIENALYGPYSGMNFATKDQFGLYLLLNRKVGQNSIS